MRHFLFWLYCIVYTVYHEFFSYGIDYKLMLLNYLKCSQRNMGLTVFVYLLQYSTVYYQFGSWDLFIVNKVSDLPFLVMYSYFETFHTIVFLQVWRKAFNFQIQFHMKRHLKGKYSTLNRLYPPISWYRIGKTSTVSWRKISVVWRKNLACFVSVGGWEEVTMHTEAK